MLDSLLAPLMRTDIIWGAAMSAAVASFVTKLAG